MRIVIVEDEVRIRNGLARLISEYEGHEVAGRARNGREGLELILREKPDLIITDIRMPEMDGLEMLSALQKEEIRTHVVILTGYAEFDYARQALAYGAEEYLLKPVSVEELERILAKIGKKVQQEKRQFEGTPEGWLKALLEGILGDTREEAERVAAALGLEDGAFVLAGICAVDGGLAGNLPEVLRSMDSAGIKVCACACLDSRRWMAAVIQGRKGEALTSITDRLRTRRKTWGGGNTIWMYEESDRPEALQEIFVRMRRAALTASACRKRELLHLRSLDGKDVPDYQLPDRQLREYTDLLTGGDLRKAEEWIRNLFAGMEGGLWSSYSLQLCAERLSTVTRELVQRFWPERKRIIDELDTTGKLRKAVTLEELKEELLRMPAALSAETGSKETIRNFTILRAIAYIRENFSRKISLEEIAAELSITPEYLSMLFTREIGINYSVFLSEYRISQAKRMLRGTDQKIYEIATQTGFSDTKYFSKVFRDVTGVTPREYRESVRRD